MDKEEVKFKEEIGIKRNSPALPPNYVSIAQLQERWLQRKQQELERQKAQAESKNQDDLKPRKGFSQTPQNSNNRGPPSEGHHVSDHQVYSRLKGKELDGFAGDNGMDKNVNLREIGEANYKKKTHGVEKGRKGGGKEHGVWKIKEEKDCCRTQGKNRYCNAGGVEGTASVFMVEAARKSVGKEIKPEEKDCSRTQGKNRYRNAAVEGTASVFMVEAVCGSVGKEIKPGEKDCSRTQGENQFRNAGGVEGTASVFMVEAVRESVGKESKEIKPEEKDCSRTQGKNRYRDAGVEGTASVFMVEAVHGSVGKEIKPVELLRKSDVKMVKDRENLRKNGDGRVKRNGRKSKVKELPENAMRKEDLGVLRGKNAALETGITGNFRGLSFVDSKNSYVSSRMGGRENYQKYTRYPVTQKPVDNRCVWVKKGEISATNVAEIDSGPSKLVSTGTDEDEREREREGESADLNRRS